MAMCSRCNTPTDLYINDFPVCPDCAGPDPRRMPHLAKPANVSLRTGLIEQLAEASDRAFEASEHFNKIMGDTPSGLSHPDGTQRIHNASRALSDARREMVGAHNRLHTFLTEEEGPKRAS